VSKSEECIICKSKIKMLLYCNGCHRRKIAQAKQDRTQAIYDKAKKFGGGEITDNWIKLMRWLEKELQGGAGGE